MKIADNADEFVMTDGDLAVRVSVIGGAIVDARYQDVPFLLAAGGPDGEMASFPLVPFGNRVEHNAFTLDGTEYRFRPNSTDPLYIHGDGWLANWDVEALSSTELTLSLRHTADETSPYDYSAQQTVSVSGNSLTILLSVINTGQQTLPFGLGHHPFFVRTPQTRLMARAVQCWSERAGHLPDKPMAPSGDLDFGSGANLPQRFVNNAMDGWDGTATIHWPENDFCAEINVSPQFDIVMLYLPGDRQDFFCFEPMSHLPNGHHMRGSGGLQHLAPGQSLSAEFSIHMRRMSDG